MRELINDRVPLAFVTPQVWAGLVGCVVIVML